MPITSIGSYGPTMEAFNINWTQANSELGATPLTLAGGYTRALFETNSQNVLAAIEAVQAKADEARTAATARDSAKLALLTRAKQFRNSVQAQITDETYLVNLPKNPRQNHDLSKFSEPLQTMERLWSRIDANSATLGLSGPLTLQGGYDLAEFTTDIGQLETLYREADTKEEAASFARSQRDTQLEAIFTRMKQYRAAAQAALPPSSPALQNLPRLSPPPGTTPPAVVVTGVWEPGILKARLSWPASTAPHLDKLQVRACTGGSYKNSEEEIIADLPGNATQYESDWGLTIPGAIVSFKVYVMATTSNENGGKAVKIVRPET